MTDSLTTPQNYCKPAEVEIDIHQLRHAHATNFNGVSIEAVRRRLGHGSTETTQIYTHSQELHQMGEKPQVA